MEKGQKKALLIWGGFCASIPIVGIIALLLGFRFLFQHGASNEDGIAMMQGISHVLGVVVEIGVVVFVVGMWFISRRKKRKDNGDGQNHE